MEDEKLAMDAFKTRNEQQRDNARLYIDTLKGLRRNRDDYGSTYLEEIWPEEP